MTRPVAGSEVCRLRRALVGSVTAMALVLPIGSHSDAAAKIKATATDSVNCLGGSEAFSTPGEAHLMDFTSPDWSPSLFYAGAEGTTAVATISVRPGDCVPGGISGRGTYTTENGSAVATADYTPAAGETPLLCNDLDTNPDYCPISRPRWEKVLLPLHSDATTERAIESFRFRVISGSVGVDEPSSAPVHVIDTDGTERFSLEPDLSGSVPVSYERGEFSSGSAISLPVFRAGPAIGAVSVGLTTASTGEHPATQGQDYEAPATVSFAEGARLAWIRIAIINDTFQEEDETLQVTLNDPGAGELIASTTVTLLDNDAGGSSEEGAPLGRLHHPREGLKYPQNYPYVKEIHIFTHAYEKEFPVFRAELALRKRLKAGGCRWWNGNGFTASACDEIMWFGGLQKPSDDYFRYRLKKKLPLSVGRRSNVRDYTMWGRWWDEAGRMSKLRVGRNLSRFEIIEPCKNPFNFKKCKPIRPS